MHLKHAIEQGNGVLGIVKGWGVRLWMEVMKKKKRRKIVN